jgi:hypothetical protein
MESSETLSKSQLVKLAPKYMDLAIPYNEYPYRQGYLSKISIV